MDGALIGAVAGMSFLTIINIAAVAYWAGGLRQKVSDLCRRVERLEDHENTARGG